MPNPPDADAPAIKGGRPAVQGPCALSVAVRRSLRSPRRALSIGAAITLPLCAVADSFPPVLELNTLDGTSGFVMQGTGADGSGRSVSGAGDVNGDGWLDLIIGAPGASPDGRVAAGVAYVVFGGPTVGASGNLDLATLDGSNGYVIEGLEPGEGVGTAVAGGGDVNGDGTPDLLTGAIGADPYGLPAAGASYVVFGGPSVGADGTIEVAFDGTDGITFNSVDDRAAAGTSVDFLFDFNDDGIDDLIIGADGADAGGNELAGQSYVFLGGPNFGGNGTRTLLPVNGIDSFAVNGLRGDLLGGSVSDVGDVNNDGINDLIIGAIWADPNGNSKAGESLVIFGKPGPFSPVLIPPALDGTNGFRLQGINADDLSGLSVSDAGDVNGDGFVDIIIGALQADPGGLQGAGEAYVVFGGPGVGASGIVDLGALDGSDGFAIPGLAVGDNTGAMVAPAGDINGDGIDDVVIGAYKADPDERTDAGRAYVIFGASDLGTGGTLDLSTLDGHNGFTINGLEAGDRFTRNTSFGRILGDFNEDGTDDLLFGAPNAQRDGQTAGESYVIYGRPIPLPAPMLALLGVLLGALGLRTRGR